MIKRLASLLTAIAFTLFSSPAFAALVSLPGQGFQWPSYPVAAGTMEDSNSNNVTSLNASGVKLALIGRVYQKDLLFRNGTNTKDLQSIGFNAGAKSGTWTLQVSAQSVSTSAGPPVQPTGTILGGGNALATIASGSVTASAFNTSPNFTSNATGLHYGDLIAVVFEFSAYTSGSLGMPGQLSTDTQPWGSVDSIFNGASWAPASISAGSTIYTHVQLNFSDGTVGTFAGDFVLSFSSSISQALNTTSNPREIGLQFQLPMSARINALCAAISTTNASSNGTIKLTDTAGTPNVLASVNFVGSQNRANGASQGLSCYPITPQTLTRGTNYVVALQGTTASANNVTGFVQIVPGASSWDTSYGCGQLCGYVSRTSSTGTWSAIDYTKMPYMTVVICAVPDGT